MRFTSKYLWSAALLSAVWTPLGCKTAKPDKQTAPLASATGSVVVNALSEQQSPYAKARKKYVPKPAPTRIPIPTGPMLAILAGQGVGPIRIGATVATIERHMDMPCEVQTETLCRYIGRAVDFELKDGVVKSILVHRMERPAGKDKKGERREFGIFKGAIPPDFQLMMKQQVVEEHLGTPVRKERVKNPGPFNTIERHYYDGLIAEYDRYKNGNMVLGGVRIVKPSAASAAASSTPSASSK